MKTDTRLAVQQGAALLLAMMTVVLVATLASAMLWQQWRTTSVETAERQSQQAHWLLVGAHDWSRVVMREDSLGSNTDHLGEPWARAIARCTFVLFFGRNTRRSGTKRRQLARAGVFGG